LDLIGLDLDLDWIELKSDWAGLHVDQHQAIFSGSSWQLEPPVMSRRSRRGRAWSYISPMAALRRTET